MANTKSWAWGKWVALLVLVGAGFGGWRWYVEEKKDSIVEYRTNVVARGDIIQQVTANGQITPVKNVTVGTQVSGIVKEIFVDFNSHVSSNEVIARIDPSTYEQNLEQAQADLANAQAALEYAELSHKRAKGLVDASLIPPSDYDKAVVDLHQGQAVVRTREAALKKAAVDLERTTIFAPIEGVVISRNVDVGQTVAASFNTPTLFQIANDLARMEIDAMVSEADVGGVEEGQSVNFTVDAFPQRRFHGVIRQVRFAPSTNQNVVNYTTVVDVNNADLKLRPGMTANASIVIAERKGAIRIPNAALRFRPPTDAVVEGRTNAPASEKGKPEIATSGPFAGLPVPPWQAGGVRHRPTEDERTAYENSLTDEQKEKYRQIVAEMRARFAQNSGSGSEGSPNSERPRRRDPEGPRTQTIYVIERTPSSPANQVTLKPVTVKLGISDGTNTEVTEGLKEGDVVVTGTVASAAASTTPTPFGNPFGGPGRR